MVWPLLEPPSLQGGCSESGCCGYRGGLVFQAHTPSLRLKDLLGPVTRVKRTKKTSIPARRLKSWPGVSPFLGWQRQIRLSARVNLAASREGFELSQRAGGGN